MVGIHNRRNEFPFPAVVFHGPHIALDHAVHDDLAAHVRGGLEEDGIHPHVRGNARRFGLDHLGPAHLPAVCGDEGVQGHVLTFKGGDPKALLFEDPAQARGDQAFPRPGHGALDHDIFSHAVFPPLRIGVSGFPPAASPPPDTSPGQAPGNYRSFEAGSPGPAGGRTAPFHCKTAGNWPGRE